MMTITINEIGWFVLFIFQLFIAAIFMNTYLNDRDKRKLIFSLGFLTVSYSHFYEMIAPFIFGQTPVNLFTAIQYWSFLPLVFAIAIAVHEKNLFRLHSDNMFTIFSALCIGSFFLSIINPGFTISYIGLFSLLFGVEIALIAFYNSFKHEGLSDIIFLCALLGYLVGGVGLLGYLDIGISIYGFITGNLFFFIVYKVSKSTWNIDRSTISNYFSIEKELAETKLALSEREKTFQTLFNEMADPVMILDKKGKFLELTEKVKDYTGYEREEIIGKNFLNTKLLTPKSKAVSIKNLMKRMSGIDVKPYEVEAVRKDGKKIPFEVNATPIRYHGKKADMVVFRDISQRKLMQEKLKESKKTLADIIENSPIPMFVIDKNHLVTHWNQALTKISNISAKQVIGTHHHWKGFYAQKRPLMADLVVENVSEEKISELYDGKYKPSIVEESIEAEDFFPSMGNKGKWLHFSASPLKNDQGNVVGAIEMLQDITERKQVEQKEKKLLKKSLFLSKTADELNRFSADDDIFEYIGKRVHEITGNCLVAINSYDINTHHFKILQAFGLTPIINKISSFLHIELIEYSTTMKSKKYIDLIKKGTLQNISRQEFKKMILPNFPHGSYTFANKILNLDEIYVMGLEEKGRLFGGIIIIADKNETVENKDVIETFCNQATVALQRNNAMKELSEMNKNLEEKVRNRTQRIEKLLKQKDQFINQLGHDLKNPLGPLINLIPLVKKHTTNKKDKDILKVVQRNVEYMRNLVEKTLELARLNSSNTKLHLEKINLHSLFTEIIEKNHYLFEKNSIAVEQQIPSEITFIGDELRLEELFTNLLNNAVKYSPDGGTVRITAKENNDHIIISIKDQGIGMTKNQLTQVFDEFYKADSSRHDFESSGLGMPISKRIVEIHHGKIWVDSPGPGKGSTFSVSLPLDHRKNISSKNQSNAPYNYDDISEKIDTLIKR